MINVPFTTEQYQRLEKLLEIKTGEHVDGDRIMAALGDAVELSLTLSHGSGRRNQALIDDARSRAAASNLNKTAALPADLVGATLRQIKRQGG